MKLLMRSMIIFVVFAAAASLAWSRAGSGSEPSWARGGEGTPPERDNYYRLQAVIKNQIKIEEQLRNPSLSEAKRKNLEKKLMKLQEKEKRLR